MFAALRATGPVISLVAMLAIPTLATAGEPTSGAASRSDAASQRDAVTYDDVLKLLRLGIDEQAILKRLRQSPAAVVLNARQIEDLKAAGASDEVLKALSGQHDPAAENAESASNQTVAYTVRRPVLENEAPASIQASIFQRVVPSTAWVVVKQGDQVASFGTGWVLDAQRRLLVTNEHVVATVTGQVHVYFPAYRDGELVHEPDYYLDQVRPVVGTVVYSEPQRDLALLQLESLPPETPALKLAERSPPVGDRLHSVAALPSGSEGLWVYTSGTVRVVYRRTLANGFVAKVVETQLPINLGNSGGPVVNDGGDLVAVVEGLVAGVQLVSMFVDISEVRAFLDQALPLVEPKSADDYRRRGQNHFDAGRLDLALVDFTELVRLDSDPAAALAKRGWIFFYKGDLDTALAEFNDALRRQPGLADAYHGRALVHRAANRPAEWLADLTEAIRFAPDKARLYAERAEAYAGAGSLDRAVTDLNRAIHLEPQNPEWFSRLGVMLDLQNLREEALQAYSRAIELDGGNSKHYAYRGNTLRVMERYDEAMRDFEKAIEINPQDSYAFSEIGHVLVARGQPEQALEAFSMAIARNDSVAGLYIYRGNVFKLLKRHDEAVNDLTTAVNLAPQSGECLNELGNAHFEMGRYDLAAECFARAAELVPQNSLYFRNLGNTYRFLGDYQRAVEALTTAIRVDSSDPLAYIMRGLAHQELKNADAAKADYNQAVALDPGRFKLAHTRKLRLVNSTGEPMRVMLRYYARGVDGKWHWYSNQPGGGPFEIVLAPGESTYLVNQGVNVHANRVRLWGVGQQSGRRFEEYKDQDLHLAPAEGYVCEAGNLEDFTFTFQ